LYNCEEINTKKCAFPLQKLLSVPGPWYRSIRK